MLYTKRDKFKVGGSWLAAYSVGNIHKGVLLHVRAAIECFTKVIVVY